MVGIGVPERQAEDAPDFGFGHVEGSTAQTAFDQVQKALNIHLDPGDLDPEQRLQVGRNGRILGQLALAT